MKNILLLSVLGLMVFITACKKDTPDYTGFEDVSGVSEPVLSTNYQPLKAGTFWKYSQNVETETETSTITMSGTIAAFNGKDYQFGTNVYTKSQNTDSVYFRSNGNEFIQRDIADGDTSELLYLKSDAAIGATWSADLFNTDPITRVTGKMVEKDITKKVLTKTFKNVIHTHFDLQTQDLSGAYTTFSTYEYYIAQGIGIIQIDITVFGITASSKITDYSIK